MKLTKREYFFLTPKEEAAMRVLWNSNKPLSATEIVESIPDRKWPSSSIQSIIKRLEKKNAIKVEQIAKIGKSYGRLFLPTLTANDYAVMQFNHFYKRNHDGDFSFIASLLGNHTNKKDMAKALQALLKEVENDEDIMED